MRVKIYDEKSILNDISRGVSRSDIVKKYHIKSGKTLYDIIKRNGREHKIANKKYSVDSNYFKNIDNEEKAYWLGFLYADGNVRFTHGRSGVIQLKLKFGDRCHIERFNSCLRSTYPIADGESILNVKGRSYKSFISCVRISNTDMAEDLVNNGCVVKKTFKIKYPSFLDSDLNRHFIRGYFDGDGCVSSNKPKKYVSNGCSILGTIDLLNYMSDILLNENIRSTIVNKGKMKMLIIIGGNKGIVDFKNYLYNGSNIFLNRKKEIFDRIVVRSAYDINRGKSLVSRKYRIVQLSMDGLVLKTWECMYDVLNSGEGYCKSGIYQCSNGKYTNHKGYKWKLLPI